MAKKKGRLMLVKIHDGVTALPNGFETLCGLTAKTLSLNNEEIDVTTSDCDAPGGKLWTEVMDGVSRVSVSGNGLSKKEDAEARLALVMMASPPTAMLQVIVPNFGTFEGTFFVSAGEFVGEQTNGQTFSFSAGSSGTVAFTAEV